MSRTAASTIMGIVYDYPPLKSAHDPYIARINDFVERLARAAYPGTYLVEVFTWMLYIPSFLAPWKKEAQEWHIKDSAMFEELYGEVERRVVGPFIVTVFFPTNNPHCFAA